MTTNAQHTQHTAGPFDLMKDNPPLDVPTLNWIWDTLWRREACSRVGRQNNDRRSRAREDIKIMAIIEDEARAAIAKATGR